METLLGKKDDLLPDQAAALEKEHEKVGNVTAEGEIEEEVMLWSRPSDPFRVPNLSVCYNVSQQVNDFTKKLVT